MSANNIRDMDRLDELLADEASAALDTVDAPELKGLLDRNPRAPRDELMEAAALAQIALLCQAQRASGHHPSSGRMPPDLKERLATQGRAAVIQTRSVPAGVQAPPARTRVRNVAATIGSSSKAAVRTAHHAGLGTYLGWALAAMLAVALVIPRADGPATSTDSVSARASLMNKAPDVITLPWTPPEAADYKGVTGDVVWSQSRQQGYLRLANMPVNDPTRSQYQLWIVDPERDSHPVDGGVFNVSSTGEVVIPIQAKLGIRSPKAFAITAEKPGGVVVSAGPLLVVAST